MTHRHTRAGVALLDVLIAALLLGIGLSVTLSMASQALRAEQTGEWRLTASWLADEALAMVVAVGPEKYQQSEPMEGRFEEPFNRFDWSLEMKKPSDWEPWQVRATVNWQDRGGPARGHDAHRRPAAVQALGVHHAGDAGRARVFALAHERGPRELPLQPRQPPPPPWQAS